MALRVRGDVEQGEQEDPDDVDEVPVEARDRDAREAVAAVMLMAR
jgi:hypothetical protein